MGVASTVKAANERCDATDAASAAAATPWRATLCIAVGVAAHAP